MLVIGYPWGWVQTLAASQALGPTPRCTQPKAAHVRGLTTNGKLDTGLGHRPGLRLTPQCALLKAIHHCGQLLMGVWEQSLAASQAPWPNPHSRQPKAVHGSGLTASGRLGEGTWCTPTPHSARLKAMCSMGISAHEGLSAWLLVLSLTTGQALWPAVKGQRPYSMGLVTHRIWL